MNPTAVLIDDEPAVSAHLTKKLAALWPELEILGTAVNGRQGIALVTDTQPEVVFLDIHMPGLDGLAVAQALPAATHIVFVTAFDQYAVAAFEQEAADYLLKPVTDERLAQTIDKLRECLEQETPETTPDLSALFAKLNIDTQPQLKWLRTGLGEVTELIAVDEVVYFQADQKYTSVFTARGEHFIRTPIKELETQLNNDEFWRVHRGIIVRVDQIASARRDIRGRYTLTLRDRPESLRSSQAYGHLFKQM